MCRGPGIVDRPPDLGAEPLARSDLEVADSGRVAAFS
jgi:hypothetical protein